MKAIGWVIAIAAVLIVVIGVVLVMSSGTLLGRAIETYGSQYLGAPVRVGDANVSLADGTAAIDSLVIGNPPGFDGPPAFRLDNVTMTLNMDELSSELIALEQVTVTGANVAALVRGRESNLGAIMAHLNEQIGTAEQPEAESEVKLIIDHFEFLNAQASVESDVLGQAAVEVPDVVLDDIGRQSNGATIGQVLKQVLEPVVRAVTRRMAEQGVDLEGARERLEQNLRERGRDAVGGGLDRLRDTIRSEPARQTEEPQEQQ